MSRIFWMASQSNHLDIGSKDWYKKIIFLFHRAILCNNNNWPHFIYANFDTLGQQEVYKLYLLGFKNICCVAWCAKFLPRMIFINNFDNFLDTFLISLDVRSMLIPLESISATF